MAHPRIVLTGHCPHLKGLRWEADSLLRIGRKEGLEVVLEDDLISRHHAEVAHTETGWVVRDLGSTNGTFLNGVRLGTLPRKLRPNDVLQCSNQYLLVSSLTEGPQPLLKTECGDWQIEAVAHRSWQQALQTLAVPDDQRPQRHQDLLALLRAGHNLCLVNSFDDLLQAILDDALAALDAQRGALVLRDEATGQLQLKAVSTATRPVSLGRAFSRTAVERAFHQGQSLLCRDVSTDAELKSAVSVRRGNMASILCALLRSPRRRLGVLHLDRGPTQEPFTDADLDLGDAIAASVSVGIEGAELIRQEHDLYCQMARTLGRLIEERDQYPAGHTQRVTDYALLMAEELRLSAAERHQLRIGAPLHDVGKLEVNEAVLRKPGKLTPEEYEHVQTHTVRGAALVDSIPGLAAVVPIVRSHHERWDGGGYPDGLVGDRIPWLARIVAVANAFDAMVCDRPYRPALEVPRAFDELRDGAGKQFDPECVAAFLRLRPQLEPLFQGQGPVQPDDADRVTELLHSQVIHVEKPAEPA